MDEYKPKHPLAWGIIAGIALFSAVAVAAIQGWLPIGDNLLPAKACAECAVVESIKTVEAPAAPLAPELAAAETQAAGSAVAPATPATAAAPATPATPAAPGGEAAASEQLAAVSYSYETTVRFESGTTSVISQADPPTWKAGDKVRVVNGVILAEAQPQG